MTEHAGNGIYDDAANTVWARGSSAAVIWTTGSKHKGRQIPLTYCVKTTETWSDFWSSLVKNCHFIH